MAEHHRHPGIKKGALCAEDAVSRPAAENGGKIHAAAISTHDAARDSFIDAEAAFGRRVIQVNHEDALHPVEREALEHLDAEQREKLARMAEEGFVQMR